MNNIIKRTWDKTKFQSIESLCGMAFQKEAGGHTFEISAVDSAGPVSLSGSVSGLFLRPDGADVSITGSISSGKAILRLPELCYVVPGRFALTIYLTSGGDKTAIYSAMGTVSVTSGNVPASPGSPVTIISAVVEYQASSSGTTPPSGTWINAIPTVSPGNYLWTRITTTYSDGTTVVSYSVARQGINGTGAVNSVNGIYPDANGNVTLGDLDLYVAKSLSAPGWYRVLTNGASRIGLNSFQIDITINRLYSGSNNEAHRVLLQAVYNSMKFCGEQSLSNTLGIDKIRYTHDGTAGYVDIHYALSTANTVAVYSDVKIIRTLQGSISGNSLELVGDSPAGETVDAVYSFVGTGMGYIEAGGAVTGQGFFDLIFGPGYSIAQNTNCDALLTPGKYTCGSATVAASLTNAPYTSAFALFAVSVADAQRLVHIATPNNSTTTIKTRYFDGTSWTNWKTLTPS